MTAFYAVKHGRKPGIYNSWSECKEMTIGVSKARYAKFNTLDEAKAFCGGGERVSKSEIIKMKRENKLDNLLQRINCPAQRPSKTKRTNLSGPISKAAESDTVPFYECAQGDYFKQISASIHANHVGIEDHCVIYTDGSCRGNGQHGSVGGFAVFFDGFPALNKSVTLQERPNTNQKAELMAILLALTQSLHNIHLINKPIEIRTDSSYCIQGLSEWYSRWSRESHAKRARLINLPKFDEIYKVAGKLCDALKKKGIDGVIYLRHVKAHSGIVGNEIVDKMAFDACNK